MLSFPFIAIVISLLVREAESVACENPCTTQTDCANIPNAVCDTALMCCLNGVTPFVPPPAPRQTTLRPVVTSASTTGSASSCIDLLNPRTGASDCPSRAYLCNDNVYYDVMTQQCPKTCNRCSSIGSNSSNGTCVDLLNPRTGTSDCPSRSSLCNNQVYFDVMTVQCPKTCNRCANMLTGTTRNSTTGAQGCMDLKNPSTSISDCPTMKSYCNNTIYQSLMRVQCPATCGYCSS